MMQSNISSMYSSIQIHSTYKPRFFRDYDIKFNNYTNKIIKIEYLQDHIIKDNETKKFNIGVGIDNVDFLVENKTNILSFNEKNGGN